MIDKQLKLVCTTDMQWPLFALCSLLLAISRSLKISEVLLRLSTLIGLCNVARSMSWRAGVGNMLQLVYERGTVARKHRASCEGCCSIVAAAIQMCPPFACHCIMCH
jgi:hypothetical protein